MSLRKRLSLIAGCSVAIAVVLALSVCYFVVRGQLRSEVDGALYAQANLAAQSGRIGPTPPASGPRSGGPAQYYQFVLANGQLYPGQSLILPVSAGVKAVADGQAGTFLSDVHVGGVHLRMLTMPVRYGPDGPFGPSYPGALELARPLDGVDGILAHLRFIFAMLAIGCILLAVLLGRFAARRVLSPLGEVTQAADHISQTDDLSRRIRVRADDEVGRLAIRFNHMLDRLESSRAQLDDSVRAQRQLVADASHELRTPVTSLRTNIEVLLEGGELDEEDRRRLLTDVVEQSEELSALVSDLIELARGDQPGAATEEVRLDRVAEESIARARRNVPGIEFRSALRPVTIDGAPERLGRAINNLLDNAAHHSPPDGVVEVTVDERGVQVRDHGPGVPEADRPYVFDRFFRGSTSRGAQGSGLGLAIVRQVAEQHGGRASVADAAGGGAVFTLSLPVSEAGAAPAGRSAVGPPPPGASPQGVAPAGDPGPGGPARPLRARG